MRVDKILITDSNDTITFEKADDTSIGITLKTDNGQQFYLNLEYDEVSVFISELHGFMNENFK